MTVLVLALIAGALVGLALGGLGGGGSMLAVPALIYLLGFTAAQATTASLLIVTVTSLTALIAHARAGRVRWRTGALFSRRPDCPPRRPAAPCRPPYPAPCSPPRSPCWPPSPPGACSPHGAAQAPRKPRGPAAQRPRVPDSAL